MIIKAGELRKRRMVIPHISLNIDSGLFLFVIVSFFYGRAIFFDSQNPFVIAITGAAILQGLPILLIGAMSLVGVLTLGNIGLFMKYLLIQSLFICLNLIFGKITRRQRAKVIFLGITTSFIGGYFFVYTKDYLVYDFIMVVVEALLSGALIYIFNLAVNFIKKRGKRTVISSEEIVAMGIFIAFCLLGTNIDILGFSLCNMLSVFAIITMAYYANTGGAVTAALLLGFVELMNGLIISEVIAVYAISALLCTLLKNWGRLLCTISFVCAIILLNMYMVGFSSRGIQIYEIFIACICFVMLPKSISKIIEEYFGCFTNRIVKNDSYEERLKEYTIGRIINTSDLFKEISSTVKGSEEDNKIVTKENIDGIIEATLEEICAGCEKSQYCWKNNMKSSYNNFHLAIDNIESEYNNSKNVLPFSLDGICKQSREVYISLRHQYELIRTNIAWGNLANESKNMMWEQMGELSNIMKKLALRLEHKLDFDKEMERAITVALDEAEIYAKNVSVAYSAGTFEIEINLYEVVDDRATIESIIRTVNKTTEKSFRLMRQPIKNQGSRDTITLTEAKRYQIAVGTAAACKSGNQITGDTYTFSEIQDGKYVLILSDGMGSGAKASEESVLAINLLEKLILADFDKMAAIKALNSLLLIKTGEDTYSTIDLAIINQQNGDLQLAKLGSANSYIRKNKGIEIIKSNSLPIGILKDVEAEPYQLRLQDGEMLIMVTDGVLDSNKKEGCNEQWLVTFMENMTTKNPQMVADGILEEAICKAQGIITDDMTVLVAKLWRTK